MPAVTTGMAIVFAVILVALVLFATEPVPVDVTAIGVMVTLMVLSPWTGVTTAAGLSGFASEATITVLAMFVLSAGVQRTGIVHRLGRAIAPHTGDSERRQLLATVGLVGPLSGFVNNTAAVAVLLPMVTDLAESGKVSPSKLLIPLSYASMFGGMLTLIGTSTNLLASSLSAELLGRPFSMFEFTALGAVVTVVGTIYLLTVGPRLVPARIAPAEDLTEEFRMADYLTEVVVREDSPLVGRPVGAAFADTDRDVDVLQVVRDGEVFLEPLSRLTLRVGDLLVVRTDRETLVELLDVDDLEVAEAAVTEAELEQPEEGHNLAEVVVAPGSSLLGESLASTRFRERYDATVLALRRGDEVVRQRLDRVRLRVGDTLLVQASTDAFERLDADPDLIVAQAIERRSFRAGKTPVAVGIVAAVVGLAAAGVVPIVVSALAGAVGMVVTGCLRPGEMYDAVEWDVIFLLAGVIPLGLAMQGTGGAELLADLVLASAAVLPTVAVLGLFYLLTALLTNVISNNASVVLMIPVAFEAAGALGADPLVFVLAVTFAASTAFMTPIGYQTNLFVYGPGGYRFTDYVRVGGPLQLLFAVVTTVGLWAFRGV